MPPRSPWLLLIALLGCGTPSRRLSTRIVDDPMVLPGRMLSMGLQGEVSQRPDPVGQWYLLPSINYGLTDRLQLADLLSLRWAILDDAPLPPEVTRRRHRLSLAVRAGTQGIGSSATEGFLILPLVATEVAKHLGAQTRLSLTGIWSGQWVAYSRGWEEAYREDLSPAGSRHSTIELRGRALRQLGNHVALAVGAGVHQMHGCTLPSCGWAARGAQVSLEPMVRPWPWLTLTLELFASTRYRQPGQALQSPDQPLPSLTHAVSWLGGGGTLLFYW
jgi:hypothetical protein